MQITDGRWQRAQKQALARDITTPAWILYMIDRALAQAEEPLAGLWITCDPDALASIPAHDIEKVVDTVRRWVTDNAVPPVTDKAATQS